MTPNLYSIIIHDCLSLLLPGSFLHLFPLLLLTSSPQSETRTKSVSGPPTLRNSLPEPVQARCKSIHLYVYIPAFVCRAAPPRQEQWTPPSMGFILELLCLFQHGVKMSRSFTLVYASAWKSKASRGLNIPTETITLLRFLCQKALRS